MKILLIKWNIFQSNILRVFALELFKTSKEYANICYLLFVTRIIWIDGATFCVVRYNCPI